MIEEVGLDPQSARILTSNSLATITRMVREGMGVALLPDVVVQEMIENEELVTLDVHGPYHVFIFTPCIARIPATYSRLCWLRWPSTALRRPNSGLFRDAQYVGFRIN